MNAPAESPKPLAPDVYLTCNGAINPPLCAEIVHNLTLAIKLGRKRIHLLLQTTGGGIDEGIGLYNFIRNLPVEVITYNGGGVSSIGVIAFLAGRTRKASQTAQFMVHKTHWSSSTEVVTAERATVLADTLAANDQRVESILRAHVSMPEDRWKLHERFDLFIGAKEALEYKIIDEITDFKPVAEDLFTIRTSS